MQFGAELRFKKRFKRRQVIRAFGIVDYQQSTRFQMGQSLLNARRPGAAIHQDQVKKGLRERIDGAGVTLKTQVSQIRRTAFKIRRVFMRTGRGMENRFGRYKKTLPVLVVFALNEAVEYFKPFSIVFYGDDFCYFFAKKQSRTAAAKFKDPEIGANMLFQIYLGRKCDPGPFIGDRVSALTERG